MTDDVIRAGVLSRRQWWGAVAAPTALMLIVGFWGIERGSLWRDEGITRYVSRLPWRQFTHTLHHVDIVHAAYYLLIRVAAVFGSSELVLRTPSVLGMAGAVACTVAVGIRLSGSPRIGLTAGLLLVAIPFVSRYAQEARSYGLVCLCISATGLLLLIALDRGGRAWVGYGAVLWTAIMLNELAALIVLAHAVPVFRAGRSRRPWLIATVAAIVLALPLILFSTSQRGHLPGRSAPRAAAVEALVRDLLGPSLVVAVVLAAFIVVGLVAGGVAVRWFAAPVLFVAPIVLLLAAQVMPELWDPRYVLFAVTGAALLVAAGIDRVVRWLPAPSLVRWSVVTAAVVVLFVAQLGVQRRLRTVDGRSEDLAAAARVVGEHAHAGDGVVFVPRNYRTARLAYPGDFTRVADLELRRTPQQSGTFRGASRPVKDLPALVRAHARIWEVGRPRLGTSTAARAEHRALRRSFRLAHVFRMHGMSVREWVRNRH